MSLFPRFQIDSAAAKPAKPAKESRKFSNFSGFSRGGRVSEIHGIRSSELQELAGDDWPELKNDLQKMEAFAQSAQVRRMREKGVRPLGYTHVAECTHCGPVWLWKGAPSRVAGCPWCFVRVAGRPVPRPPE